MQVSVEFERGGITMTDQPFSASTATQDDKVVAALAHALGPLIAIIVWATQKDKSPFVAFQSLQALVYQLTGFVGMLLGMACYMCSFVGMFGSMFAIIPLGAIGAAASEGTPDAIEGLAALIGFLISTVTMTVPFAIFGLLFLAAIAFFLYGLWAAISVFQGKDFRYIVIGRWLERYLAKDAEAKEIET
jgi:uncharacterized Tic20 family protein